MAAALLATPLAADMEVLVPGGVRYILARSGDSLDGGGHLRESFDQIYWFPNPSGSGGTFFLNHELVTPDGGLSRHRYEQDILEHGVITEKRDWVIGTHFNSTGCITSWGSILSSEEHPPAGMDSVGYVVEVDPDEPHRWTRRWAMGRFSHEGIVELEGRFYMGDDSYEGYFFRFTPIFYGHLTFGFLHAYREATRDWILITDPVHARDQAAALGATPYSRLEDCAYNPLDGYIYITATGKYDVPDLKLGYINRYDPITQTMERWLDGDGTYLANPDNIEIDSYGNLLVMEDQYSGNRALYGPNELMLIRPDRSIVTLMRGLEFTGEVTGLTLHESENLFWVNWMNGSTGSEFMEVVFPPGWNAPVGIGGTGAPPASPLAVTVSPNPASTAAWIHARVEPGQPVRVDIFDARGARRRTLIDGPLASGQLAVAWDGHDLAGIPAPSGPYFVRLSAGGKTVTSRLILLR
jgi:hypothetical protein